MVGQQKLVLSYQGANISLRRRTAAAVKLDWAVKNRCVGICEGRAGLPLMHATASPIPSMYCVELLGTALLL